MQQELRLHLSKRKGNEDTLFQLVLLSAALLSIFLHA